MMGEPGAIGPGSFKDADLLMRSAVAQGVFPGAVLLVAHRGQVVFHQPYGRADLFSGRSATLHTLFDLASLTKPLATTLAAMLLVQQGVIDLDRPVIETCPQLVGVDKCKITPRHLLSHRSGLPAWRPYYMRLERTGATQRPQAMRRWVRQEPLLSTPGQTEEYSDLGFMLLQWFVEEMSGRSMEEFVSRMIYRPLQITPLFFVVQDQKGSVPSQFAATELCLRRGRLLSGQVHDDNAYAMGGVAGHAGLFGTAMAVFKLVWALARAEKGEAEIELFDRTWVHTFFQRRTGSRFTLGFDTPEYEGSSAGRCFSSSSVGHLGYTGTSFWLDRPKEVVVVLLTNRVHPSRYTTGIKAFRPQLHDTIMPNLHQAV